MATTMNPALRRFMGDHGYTRYEPVATHSKAIYDASYSIVPKTIVDSFLLRAGTFLGGSYASAKLWSPEPAPTAYRVSGAVGAVIGSALDIGSTLRGIKEIWDPRFFEYGLDDHFGERNPVIMTRTPTAARLLVSAIPFSLLITAVAYQSPSVGHAYGLIGFQTAAHNLRVVKRMKIAKNIGDELKVMVQDGAEANDLVHRLEIVVANPEEHLRKVA